MRRSEQHPSQPPRRRGHFARLTAAAAVAFALAASVTALALASGGSPTVGSADTKLGRVVVNGQGHTLYALRPETVRHLLCKSKACFAFWPPLTVGSGKAKLTAGAGVHGRLGVLHRDGIFQVTLNKMPLYRYSGDRGKAEVNGQHIHTFGGVWHVIAAGSSNHRQGAQGAPGGAGTQTSTASSSSTSTGTTTSTATTSTAGGYGW
jgi:predicted lipoprotein with Yx(FWY)xxD motif